jgi:hypothetical protein
MSDYNKEAVRLSFQNKDTEVYVLFDGGNTVVSLVDENEIGVEGFWTSEIYENGKRIWEEPK